MTNAATTATLFAPHVRLYSTDESEFDAMMTWRAELVMSYLAEDELPEVLAGYADFLIINVGEHPIEDLLDSLSDDAEDFGALFDGADIADTVVEQFDDAPFNRILIITDVTVGASLRGHDLGAWLVAEVIARMASPTDTLVLLYPHSIGTPTGRADDAAAAQVLSRYWRQVGLVPIDDQPELMGQATAYTHLPRARAALRRIGDVEIDVPAALIAADIPVLGRRHTVFVPEAAGRALQVVRD